MDAERFDAFLRTFGSAPSRRGALRLLAGAALGGVVAAGTRTASAKKKGKGKGGGKSKKKGCAKGQKRCGNRCIPVRDCCPEESDDGCRCSTTEHCVGGRCECKPEYVRMNGFCGLFPYRLDDETKPCLSAGQSYEVLETRFDACCSQEATPDQNGMLTRICAAGKRRCLANTDCVSGPCFGFLCPELWPAFGPECVELTGL